MSGILPVTVWNFMQNLNLLRNAVGRLDVCMIMSPPPPNTHTHLISLSCFQLLDDLPLSLSPALHFSLEEECLFLECWRFRCNSPLWWQHQACLKLQQALRSLFMVDWTRRNWQSTNQSVIWIYILRADYLGLKLSNEGVIVCQKLMTGAFPLFISAALMGVSRGLVLLVLKL